MTASHRVEVFAAAELLALQCDLQQTCIDSWQARDLLAAFLNGRGYGVDGERIRESLWRLERANCNVEAMQTELERVALVM